MEFATVKFESYKKSIPHALDAIWAGQRLAEQSAVLIKPNLVNNSPRPITTPPECCEAIVDYIRRHSDAEVVIAEGCGDANLDTPEIFSQLEYTEMARRKGVELVDLNHAPLRKLDNPECKVFPQMHLPEIAFTHYIISVPVLKAHSLAVMTGTLKNMMGFAPPKHYHSPDAGVWKKSVFHTRMQDSLIDLNRYIKPDLSVMDASVGMAEHHLRGEQCDPPVNKIVAGYNPWDVDREAAGLLGLNWREIRHISARLGGRD